LEALSKEFVQEFDSIYDDTSKLFFAANTFIDKYESMEDTSKSYKKHVVLDDLGKKLRKELRDILRGINDDDGSLTTIGNDTMVMSKDRLGQEEEEEKRGGDEKGEESEGEEEEEEIDPP